MPDTKPIQPAWITIGSFDGVHLGHQALIRQLVQMAQADNCKAVVVTFYPHPAVVLRNVDEPFYLSSRDEREELLRQLGTEVITLPFTHELANMAPEEFMQALQRQEQVRVLLVGSDFALGRGRTGNTAVLAELGQRMGFEVKIFAPIQAGETVISSSQIRSRLADGDVETANRMLGRRYALTGRVVAGQGRGRTIGIPTVNVEFSAERLMPASGVYATWVLIGGQKYASVTNIGVRPTFESQPVARRLETHVLDLQADLYDQDVTVEFTKFLRPEMRFSSVETLIQQIQQDISLARKELERDR
jgi:riboflavin kinase / FMN adenylyltransferase